MYKNNVRTINDCSNITDLYNWHLSELVDDNERIRNDKTEIHQGNRNPYIDYPELIGYAWGFTSDSQNPYLNFTTEKVAIHPDLADGKSVTIEIEISPKPQSPENITISADANSTLTNYSFSKTNFTIDSNSSLQSFTVNLSSNTQGYLQINFDGLSPNIDYGYNDKFYLYVSENLGNDELSNQNQSFNVYPSPFNETLTIAFFDELNINSPIVNMYNMLGKRVENIVLNSDLSINTTNLPKGIYFIEIEGLGRRKIVKK